MKERIIKQSEAQVSDVTFETLVKEYKRSLLACASRTVNHFVTDQDEEWSIVLQAFYEAVKNYEPGKGEFWPFASVIVRRRLTDWLRELYRRREGESEEISEMIPAKENWPGEYTIRDEIEAVQEELKQYSFTFFDLTRSSPRTQKSRQKCAAAIAALLRSDEMTEAMEKNRTLPKKQLAEESGISGKILEKHRRYIIAAAIILKGEYPLLSEYLHIIRKEAGMAE